MHVFSERTKVEVALTQHVLRGQGVVLEASLEPLKLILADQLTGWGGLLGLLRGLSVEEVLLGELAA